MSPRSSLRSRMLWRVLVPLALTWLAGTAVMVAVAYLFTRQAFDRSLLDDAYAIAANVNPHDGDLALNLSSRELHGILFDRSEHVFFAVLRQDGSLVAGDDELRREVADLRSLPEFGNLRHRGEVLRMATVRRAEPLPFAVLVAHTTTSRTQLVERLLIVSVAPQALLLVLLGLWLRHSIARELLPLAKLQQGLERRDSTDLAPVDVDAASREVDRLAQTVNSLMARIARGVQAQREFAGNVAHELRTPLAGIRALAEYGIAQKDPVVWQAQLRSIAASQERASRLVDQLLALALADEAHDSLRLEPVMLDELVRRSVLMFVPRADAAGVDLGAVGLDTPQCVLGSVALLEGLLNNLIDNALRYGRPLQDTPPRVTVELRREAGEVMLSVIDNGPGMDASQHELVLRRWAQGDAGARLGQGAGLGLAIVGRYTALLGGRLVLAGAPAGTGLRATVFLRAAQAE